MTAMHARSPVGALVVLAAVAGLALGGGTVPSTAALVGLALLALAGAGTVAWPGLPAVVLVAPGAVLVGVGVAADVDGPGWLPVAAGLVVCVASPLALDVDRRWSGSIAAPVLYAIAALAVVGCVPDTEEARVLAAAAVVGALLGLAPPLRSLGAVGTPAAVGLLVWVSAFDARGRPAAFVGAAAALGLLALEPIGARLRRGRAWVRGRAGVVVLIGGQLVLAAVASRVIGLERDLATAGVLVLPWAVVAIAVGAAVGREPSSERRAVAP
jgi:hypothetical protein